LCGAIGSAIGSITSAKLHEDFVRYASAARRYYLAPQPTPNTASTSISPSRKRNGRGREPNLLLYDGPLKLDQEIR
jgi:hypothetical protein